MDNMLPNQPPCFTLADKCALYLDPQSKHASYLRFYDFFFYIFLFNRLSVYGAPVMCLELHTKRKSISLFS